jgi:hypothetical protein
VLQISSFYGQSQFQKRFGDQQPDGSYAISGASPKLLRMQALTAYKPHGSLVCRTPRLWARSSVSA